MENLAYLGTAMKNPIQLLSGRAAIVGGYSIIEQSILDILATPVGTRLFLPEYGSRLNEMLFEPNDEILLGMARMLISEALTKWEQRTRFVDVALVQDERWVKLKILHVPLSSTSIQSFVFPFYKKLEH